MIPFIAILALVQFLALDITLPIFVTWQSHFQVSSGDIQQTVSAYFLGMASGQVVWGALSDTLGRRVILVASLTVFTVATFACAYASSIESLWMLRFVQALGVSAPAALWQTLLVDSYAVNRREVIFAWMFPITALSPIIMPMLGAWLLGMFGFQSTFFFITAVGMLLWLYAVFFLKETLSPERRHPLALKTYLRHAIRLMSCPVFMGHTGLICLSSASFFVFITEFPFALAQLGLPESAIGPLLIPQTLVFMLGGALSAWMSRRFGKSPSLCFVALLAVVFSGVLLALVTFVPVTHIWQIVAPYSVTAFSNGAIYPLSFSSIFEAHDDKAGTAAGWVAFYLALMGFLGAFLMGIFSEQGVVGMACLVLGLYGFCFISWLLTVCFVERDRSKLALP